MALFKRRGRRSKQEADEPIAVAETPRLPDPPAPIDGSGRRAAPAQRDYLLSLVEPLPAFGMYLLDAWGTAICEDISADANVPADDLVAVSGFAVRSEDLRELLPGTRTTLRIRVDDRVAKVGSAVAVQAGQILPEGADAVVPSLRCRVSGNVLTLDQPVRSGEFVRWAGSEVRPGVPLLRSGDRLDARRSALLAMAGIDRVLARPRPRVVVLSVAEEGSDPADVESHLLAAALKADGAQVWRVPLGAGADRELQDAISDQLIRADLVVASGLLDDEARLPRVVSQMGLLDLSSVALQPGGRIGCALVGEDRIPLALVADDPAEAYVGYQYFVRPLVRKLMGVPVVHRPVVSCLAGGDLVGSGGQVELRFGVIREEQGEQVAVPLGKPEHPRFTDLVTADALLILDEGTTHVELGDRIGCWLLAD